MSGKLSRRTFVTGTAAALAAAACDRADPSGRRQPAPAPAPVACSPSPQTTVGPYYLSGAPTTDRLVKSDAPGRHILVRGIVLDADCRPLPRARLDLWQADSAAAYDLAGYTGRGVVVADGAGAFRFWTIVPGSYLDNGRFRPAHIHATISPPDGRDDPPLTTQLFFAGDPYADGDKWWDDSLAMTLSPERDQLVGRISIGLYRNRS